MKNKNQLKTYTLRSAASELKVSPSTIHSLREKIHEPSLSERYKITTIYEARKYHTENDISIEEITAKDLIAMADYLANVSKTVLSKSPSKEHASQTLYTLYHNLIRG